MDDLRELDSAATPAPWANEIDGIPYGCTPEQWPEWSAELLREGMEFERPIFTIEACDERGGVTTAITGNGPHGQANAALIVALRNAFASGDLIPSSEHERELAEKDAVILLLRQLAEKGCYGCTYDGEDTYPQYDMCSEEAGCGFADLRAAIQATKEGEGE